MNDYAELRCADGRVALVDPEDLPRVSEYVWTTVLKNRVRYAFTMLDGNYRQYLHRMVLSAKPTDKIDHRNGNGLDCRKQNLRPGSNKQNMANRRPKAGATSRYKGVSRSGKRWQAQIQIDGRNKFLGRFDSEEAAARAYDEAARRLHGEWAWQNFR